MALTPIKNTEIIMRTHTVDNDTHEVYIDFLIGERFFNTVHGSHVRTQITHDTAQIEVIDEGGVQEYVKHITFDPNVDLTEKIYQSAAMARDLYMMYVAR